jgi:hypothetical protein
MRDLNPLNSPTPLRILCVLAALTATLGVAPALAQKPAVAPASKPLAQHKHPGAKRKAAKATDAAQTKAAAPPAAPVAAKPAEPELPLWPVNERPVEASVTWNSKGLRIEAANSSLQQILEGVSAATGAKVEGLEADQRIFGVYGPGPARDVLSLLLQGTGYNVLLIGDQGQGTPRTIVLSSPHAGAAQPAAVSASDDEDDDMDEPTQSTPPPMRHGGVRTPQQITQEMQQRRQEMLQRQMQPYNAQPQ